MLGTTHGTCAWQNTEAVLHVLFMYDSLSFTYSSTMPIYIFDLQPSKIEFGVLYLLYNGMDSGDVGG